MSAYYTNKSAQEIMDFLKPFFQVIPNFLKKISGSGMTDAEKEASDTSLRNAQILADEDYQRKIDFYERYESPEAQVLQYKSAGLNTALMFGNGASFSTAFAS